MCVQIFLCPAHAKYTQHTEKCPQSLAWQWEQTWKYPDSSASKQWTWRQFQVWAESSTYNNFHKTPKSSSSLQQLRKIKVSSYNKTFRHHEAPVVPPIRQQHPVQRVHGGNACSSLSCDAVRKMMTEEENPHTYSLRLSRAVFWSVFWRNLDKTLQWQSWLCSCSLKPPPNPCSPHVLTSHLCSPRAKRNHCLPIHSIASKISPPFSSAFAVTPERLWGWKDPFEPSG